MSKDQPPATHPEIAFNQLLGIEVLRHHKDGLTVQCRVRPELLNGQGTLHGGVTATLVDVAVGMATAHRFEGKKTISTVEMKLNYFLPITGGLVRARARLLRIGTSLVIGSVEVLDEKRRLAAFGTATYKLLN